MRRNNMHPTMYKVMKEQKIIAEAFNIPIKEVTLEHWYEYRSQVENIKSLFEGGFTIEEIIEMGCFNETIIFYCYPAEYNDYKFEYSEEELKEIFKNFYEY